MEDEIKNDQELYSYFRGRNATLCRDNFTFLMEHPEVKRLLNDYLSNILLHKPDDVFKFTKDYFKFLSDKGDSDHFVVLVGPNSVGKSTLIDRIMQEIPNVFEKPKFTSSKEKENFNVISKEAFMDLLNKHEVLAYTYDNKEKEYEGITKGEIKRIIDEGKIALLEIDLAGALKINSTSFGANFIGILPPSFDELRMRIKAHTKLNTGSINKVLEKSKEEVKEIETHSFFTFRIMNDQLERGYLDFKNAIISLFPFLKYTPEDIEQVKNIPSRAEEKKKDENNDKINQVINEVQEDKKEGDEDNKSIKSNNKSVKSENKSVKSDNKSVKSNNKSIKNENKSVKGDNKSIKSEKSIKNDNQSVKSENKSVKNDNQNIKDDNQSVKSENKSVKNDNQSVKSAKEDIKNISREKSLKSVKSIKSTKTEQNKSILNESKYSEKDKNRTQSDFGVRNKSKIDIPEDKEDPQKEEEIKENETQEKKEESVHNDMPQKEQKEENTKSEIQQEENVDEAKKEEDNKEGSQKEEKEEENVEINKEAEEVKEEIKENINEKEVLSQKEESVNKSDKSQKHKITESMPDPKNHKRNSFQSQKSKKSFKSK